MGHRFEALTIEVTGKEADCYLRCKRVFYRLAPVGHDERLRVKERPKGTIYTVEVVKEPAGNLSEIVDCGLAPEAYCRSGPGTGFTRSPPQRPAASPPGAPGHGNRIGSSTAPSGAGSPRRSTSRTR